MIPRPRGRHGGSEDGRHVEGDAGLDGDRCGAADASARGRLQEEGSAPGCWGGGRCGGWPRRGGARRLEPRARSARPRARRGRHPQGRALRLRQVRPGQRSPRHPRSQCRLAAAEQPRKDRARGALRRSRHDRVQLGARCEARQGGQGLPGRARHRGGAHLDDQLRGGAPALSGGDGELLGAQPARPRGDPRQVTRRGAAAGGLLLLLGAGGCATRADIVQRDRQLRQMILEDRRQLQQVERELERLRRAVEEGPRRGGAAANDRVADLERRLAELESRLGGPEGPAGSAQAPPEEPPAAGSAAPEQPAREARAVPPETRPPAPAPSAPPAVPAPAPEEADEWQREVAREQAAVGAMGNVPERQEFAGILDGLARKDCGRAIPQLNSFAANHKDSPLADNALYWAARCYQLRGDAKQAISKFYDVVMRYPKGDKTPAALWAQGNLFVQIGDTPDARLALSELVRKYPASEEAAKARQKLSELEH